MKSSTLAGVARLRPADDDAASDPIARSIVPVAHGDDDAAGDVLHDDSHVESAGAREARARVEAVMAGAPQVRRGARPSPDRRAFPRCMGALDVACHRPVTDDPAEAARWLHEGTADSAGWSPDPFMNFSALGLAFEDEARAAVGDTLFLSLRLPRETVAFRAVARVLRVSELPVDEREPESRATHRVALRFEAIDPRGSAALVAYTLRVQSALMEGTRDS
jgi:hypothetical protein